jgi:hypothetical protein
LPSYYGGRKGLKAGHKEVTTDRYHTRESTCGETAFQNLLFGQAVTTNILLSYKLDAEFL